LKVLALYPGVTKRKNDIAQMLIELSNNGVKLTVIAARVLVQKGKGKLLPYEDMDGVSIYRLFRKPFDMFVFPHVKLKECL